VNGGEYFDLQKGLSRVGSVEFISSLSDHPDYYLITLVGADGHATAYASLDTNGWLLSATVVAAEGRRARNSVWFDDQLESAFPDRKVVKHRKVHAFNDLTSTDFEPLLEARFEDGATIYFTDTGATVREDSAGDLLMILKGGTHRRLSVAR
jgi:hypothetical protein